MPPAVCVRSSPRRGACPRCLQRGTTLDRGQRSTVGYADNWNEFPAGARLFLASFSWWGGEGRERGKRRSCVWLVVSVMILKRYRFFGDDGNSGWTRYYCDAVEISNWCVRSIKKKKDDSFGRQFLLELSAEDNGLFFFFFLVRRRNRKITLDSSFIYYRSKLIIIIRRNSSNSFLETKGQTYLFDRLESFILFFFHVWYE